MSIYLKNFGPVKKIIYSLHFISHNSLQGILIFIFLFFLPQKPFAQKTQNKKLKTENKQDFKGLKALAEQYLEKNNQDTALMYAQKSVEAYQKETRIEDREQYCQALSLVGEIYSQKLMYQNALDYKLKHMECRKIQNGVKHPDYAASLSDIATVYYYLKKLPEAESLYKQTLVIQKDFFGA